MEMGNLLKTEAIFFYITAMAYDPRVWQLIASYVEDWQRLGHGYKEGWKSIIRLSGVCRTARRALMRGGEQKEAEHGASIRDTPVHYITYAGDTEQALWVLKRWNFAYIETFFYLNRRPESKFLTHFHEDDTDEKYAELGRVLADQPVLRMVHIQHPVVLYSFLDRIVERGTPVINMLSLAFETKEHADSYPYSMRQYNLDINILRLDYFKTVKISIFENDRDMLIKRLYGDRPINRLILLSGPVRGIRAHELHIHYTSGVSDIACEELYIDNKPNEIMPNVKKVYTAFLTKEICAEFFPNAEYFVKDCCPDLLKHVAESRLRCG